jgi:cytochrome c556
VIKISTDLDWHVLLRVKTGLRHQIVGPRLVSIVDVAAFAAAGPLTTSLLAQAQDRSAAKVEDAIVARKTAMDTLSDRMDQIEQMIATNKINVQAGQQLADTISVMIMMFPHLFPPASNQWKPGVEIDPVTGTFASPDVWSKFADFYKRASDASKTAYDISRADKEDDFKKHVQKLRTACNACHAAYLKMQ